MNIYNVVFGAVLGIIASEIIYRFAARFFPYRRVEPTARMISGLVLLAPGESDRLEDGQRQKS